MGIFKRKPKKPWVKCDYTWTEKRMNNKGVWVTAKRYCSKQKGHSGGHR